MTAAKALKSESKTAPSGSHLENYVVVDIFQSRNIVQYSANKSKTEKYTNYEKRKGPHLNVVNKTLLELLNTLS